MDSDRAQSAFQKHETPNSIPGQKYALCVWRWHNLIALVSLFLVSPKQTGPQNTVWFLFFLMTGTSEKTARVDTYSDFICSFYVKDKILYEGHLIEGENDT